MEILWTQKAQDDLERIYGFASQYSQQHADEVLDRVIIGTTGLAEHPRVGISQTRYEPREVRKILFDDYEIHYEIQHDTIYIVDIWHTREDR
ncbi:type II toxin-antitoxin system RelE/ParE family toxin [Pectobacterium brasiliense]|uniref:type II toxin-antitoxin system RelE/ParE family toxin n=1 Tax=Pectobacterium brasiliense TaxID=180957 RepID=UPI0025A19777|nr:type II toxin-antitoxin system RelE/ParE family toxin [Pectobacterium brasiliense]WJM79355.1 type II toxin-antitoxin system RelE/ParE family toxin [Pectobacterium brasiliense]